MMSLKTGKLSRKCAEKAKEMSLATGIPAIADDSGLCIDALNGDPEFIQRAGLELTEMMQRIMQKFWSS